MNVPSRNNMSVVGPCIGDRVHIVAEGSCFPAVATSLCGEDGRVDVMALGSDFVYPRARYMQDGELEDGTWHYSCSACH